MSKLTNRFALRITLLLLAIGFVYAIWAASYAAYVDTIHPNSLGISMVGLEQQIGKPQILRQHMHNGSNYTLWYGEVKTIFLPSGPPVYVFGAGKLLDWTRDIGDDPLFREKWGL